MVTLSRKQLFLKSSKKFNKEGVDIGEKRCIILLGRSFKEFY
jgi:hypothetical protein